MLHLRVCVKVQEDSASRLSGSAQEQQMKAVTVLELKEKADDLVRSVMTTGEEIQITDDNEVIALLVPSGGAEKHKNRWTTLDKIAAEIDKNRNQYI